VGFIEQELKEEKEQQDNSIDYENLFVLTSMPLWDEPSKINAVKLY